MTSGPTRPARVLRGLLIAGGVAYPLAVCGFALALRYVGSDWWLTAAALFAPRQPLVLPLPLLVLGLAYWGPRWLLWGQLLAGLVWLFPLMGFVPPWPTADAGDEASLRVLSCNVDNGYLGLAEGARVVLEQRADIVLLQELPYDPTPLLDELRSRYENVERFDQFLLATGLPVLSTAKPYEVTTFAGKTRSSRFVRYVIDSPLGELDVLHSHPISSRGGLAALRGSHGLVRELSSGRFFEGAAARKLRAYAGFRETQLAEVSRLSRASQRPVLVAGDLNEPGLSPLWSRLFGHLQDGFEQAGWGFGYTFPDHERWPAWLRLDRILASEALRFTDFEVVEQMPSDHHCVVAELVRRD